MNREEAIKVLRTESIELGGSAPSVCRFWEALDMAIAALREQDAADVVPVRHGRWIWHSEERGYLCSECGSGCLLNYESDWHKSDWCPHCGAKMDLEV